MNAIPICVLYFTIILFLLFAAVVYSGRFTGDLESGNGEGDDEALSSLLLMLRAKAGDNDSDQEDYVEVNIGFLVEGRCLYFL